MARFGEIIDLHMRAKGITNRALAVAADVSTATVNTARNSNKPSTRGDTLDRIARALGTTADALRREWMASNQQRVTQFFPDPPPLIPPPSRPRVIQGQPRSAAKGVPIINSAAAGPPTLNADPGYQGVQDELRVTYKELPILLDAVGDHQAFGVTIDGNSMDPELMPGDVAVFAPAAQVEDGDVVFVQFNEARDSGQTVKLVSKLSDEVVALIPRNSPAYRVETVDLVDIARIVKMVGSYRPREWVRKPED